MHQPTPADEDIPKLIAEVDGDWATGERGIMNIFEGFGFSENPYAVAPLSGDAMGSRLLVGRDKEVLKLHKHWTSVDTHASMEGDNGVGKTSLVAVAAYRAMEDYSIGNLSSPFLPLMETFQITTDSEALERHILSVIARSIFKYDDFLKSAGYTLPNLDNIKTWLESPLVHSHGGGIGITPISLSASRGTSVNTGGFSESGFRSAVHEWLQIIFPKGSTGGFVGVIDNLEILETSQEARRVLREMRDTLLKLPGVKWVLCGANGIMRSAVGSPSLSGVIADPIPVTPLSAHDSAMVIERRIEEYRTRADATAPVEPQGFEYLYRVAGNNLRIALKHAQDFSLWADINEMMPEGGDDRMALLKDWLAQQAENNEAEAGSITRRAWTFFDKLLSEGGSCTPGEYAKYGFNSMPAMRPVVKQLEEAELVSSTVSESDQRRKTIQATSRGWLIHYKRSDFKIG